MATPELVATETAAIVFNGVWSHTTTAEGVSGDVIALLHFTQGGGGAGMEEPTSPAGSWTEHPPPASQPGWAPAIELWTRPAPVGAFTVTIPAVGVSGHQGVILLLRGATETPENVTPSFGDSTSGHTTPSVDADTDDALIVRGIATRGGDSATYTWPSSTERADTAAGSGGSGGVFSVATKVATTSGAQGTETCTGSAVTGWGEYIGISISFAGAAAGSTATLDADLPALVAAMTGEATAAGDVGATLPGLAAALDASAASTAALTATLPGLSAAVAGASTSSAAIAASLPALTGRFVEVQPAPPFPPRITQTAPRPITTQTGGWR